MVYGSLAVCSARGTRIFKNWAKQKCRVRGLPHVRAGGFTLPSVSKIPAARGYAPSITPRKESKPGSFLKYDG